MQCLQPQLPRYHFCKQSECVSQHITSSRPRAASVLVVKVRKSQFRTVSNHFGCEKVGVFDGAAEVGFELDSADTESVDVMESCRPVAAAATASKLSIDD